MNFFETVIMIFAMLVVIEFGVHIIYHAITGKAGLYDPPFQYLKDIYNSMVRKIHKKKIENLSKAYARMYSQSIISNPASAKFKDAYDLIYSDIYDFKVNKTKEI